MVEELRQIAERARQDELSAIDILKEVAEVNPELADKLRGRGLTATVLILVLLWLIKSVSIDVTVDANKLIDQAIEAVHHDDADAYAPPVIKPDDTKEVAPTPTTKVAMQSEPLSRRAQRRARGRGRMRPTKDVPPERRA